MNSALFLTATYKIAMTVRNKGRQWFSIGSLTMCFLCLANFVRAMVNVIDPIESRRIIPNPWENIMVTITFPLTSMATLAITFYWFVGRLNAASSYPDLCSAGLKS